MMGNVHESDDWGMFTTDGPWVLVRDRIAWLPDAARLRAEALDEMRSATQPSRLPPGARGAVVAGRLGSALAAWQWRKRLGRFDDDDAAASRADLSRRLRLAAEALGPTYIKLAQIISAGEGLFPPELVGEFRLCRDQVPSETIDTVRRTVEEDLGQRLDDVFSSFDEVPLAAASIAQVHAAVLHSGESVVVKVQRPTVARRVRDDLRVMAWL
ncbi:MAG: AarF/ABC1/UbiB kinase family protein, partial [Acidimicrobiia bacterium]|nr:AarF/ABC1/UbiB kinase family protein [Acidimicrobiia bacterium]